MNIRIKNCLLSPRDGDIQCINDLNAGEDKDAAIVLDRYAILPVELYEIMLTAYEEKCETEAIQVLQAIHVLKGGM